MKSPTHATSARIVRVRSVISQAISDEGTMEVICDDDDVMDDDDAKIAHKLLFFIFYFLFFAFCID